jgi:hypothetical protein
MFDCQSRQVSIGNEPASRRLPEKLRENHMMAGCGLRGPNGFPLEPVLHERERVIHGKSGPT